MALDELFPESPRVVYRRAPLTQVICQLRFPTILRIESPAPAEFQERVRDVFPFLEIKPSEFGEFPAEMVQAWGVRPGPQFSFQTEDRKNTLNLGSEAIALITTAYTHWDDFALLLRRAVDALIDIYRPSFFQRVGLRYVNIIDRAELGIEGMSWSELIRKELLGELALPQFEENASDAKRNIRLKFPNDQQCGVYLQHGYAQKKGVAQLFYRLDYDFYRDGKTEVADAKRTLDSFNAVVGRAFRWSITPFLHERLEPAPMELAVGLGR